MMKVTNKYNLPESFVHACSRDYSPSINRISVTQLIDSPLIRRLRIAHWDKIEVDVSDMIWMLLGTSVHYVLEQHSILNKNLLTEEYLTAEIDGQIISGQIDLMDNNGVISDYKVTSVYAFLLSDKDSWHKQLNVYKWLYNKNGFDVSKLQIVAILRDWSKMKSLRDSNYPEVPVIIKEIDIMSNDEVEEYIRERIKIHNDINYECSDEEKWARGGKFAVMKKGRKRALKLFDKKEDAEEYLKSLDDKHYIEERPKEYFRCENFCDVNKFCPFYQKLKGGNNEQ
jgi:hypothetical protein